MTVALRGENPAARACVETIENLKQNNFYETV